MAVFLWALPLIFLGVNRFAGFSLLDAFVAPSHDPSSAKNLAFWKTTATDPVFALSQHYMQGRSMSSGDIFALNPLSELRIM